MEAAAKKQPGVGFSVAFTRHFDAPREFAALADT